MSFTKGQLLGFQSFSCVYGFLKNNQPKIINQYAKEAYLGIAKYAPLHKKVRCVFLVRRSRRDGNISLLKENNFVLSEAG